jgi:8-oxo-dGTP pyrophosphatase MutT (NUDIX family)
MVQRKDSLSYSTFIRGKYKLDSKKYLIELFENMTELERNNIKTKDFETLWKELWKVNECNSFLREFEDAKSKFNILKNGIHDNKNTYFDIMYLIDNTKSKYDETEWGFPKGRRNTNESDFQCAIREFSEETSIPYKNIKVLFKETFNEIFVGGNKLKYKHVYFVCQIFDETYMNCKTLLPSTIMQEREIQKVEWFDYDNAQKKIRPGNKERKDLLKFIHNSIMNFPLSCIQKN